MAAMSSEPYFDDITRRAVHETYLEELCSKLKSPEFENTRASVIELRTSGKTSHTEITSLAHLYSKVQELDTSWTAKQSPIAQKAARVQLVVIENPSPAFINFLGTYYEVSPEFFADHTAGCTSKKNRVPPRLPSQSLRSSFFYADGVQSYRINDLVQNAPGFKRGTEVAPYLMNRRHYFKRKWCYRPDKMGFQLEDRVSYFSKSRGENDWIGKFLDILRFRQILILRIAICLIDPRLSPRRPTEHDGALRLPGNDDGWQGNQFLSTTSSPNSVGFSLHDAFTKYLAHDFTLDEFVEDAFSPSVFLYLHLALVWNEQVAHLTSDLGQLSFNQEPYASNANMIDQLHEMRSSLFHMSTCIQHICEHLEYRTEASCVESTRRESWGSSNIRCGTIRSRFQDLHYDFKYLLCRTQELQSLATESINMLLAIPSIPTPSTPDTEKTFVNETTIHQNNAVINLTRLLAIYLPLIFGGIIFGMNVQEINSSGPAILVFILVTLSLVSFTFLAIIASKHMETAENFKPLLLGFPCCLGKRKWRRAKAETGAV